MATESGQAKASANQQPVSLLGGSTEATQRHIKNAFKAGATVEEIMEVLKLGVVQGVQACNLGVTLLTEELERDAAA
jgi:alkylhydroperoxidase/carboxymuconolactone decarboxylase family protein YurZ